MTESNDGSDLGATVETVARPDGSKWRLTGDKYSSGSRLDAGAFARISDRFLRRKRRAANYLDSRLLVGRLRPWFAELGRAGQSDVETRAARSVVGRP